jgi:Astacin (Peptidase family M12A)
MGARPGSAKLWRGGIVPYEINPDLGNTVAIHSAITTLEQQTNLRFVGRFIQKDFLRFSKQTKGNANSKIGRQGGRQFVNASLNDVGTILHELGHALGLMHEHQREDRDQFVIFHADRVTADADQYQKEDTQSATANYDFQSLMHYGAGEPGNPVFESRTGVPVPGQIGGRGSLTITDRDFLQSLYPATPIIRRTDGQGGASGVLQTSAIAVQSVNNTAIVANAIQNASGEYQLVLWRVRDNGVVLRMTDPAGATGGKASNVRMVQVGGLFVSAMRNADDELLLISHDSSFGRLKDSGDQAGKVRALHLVPLSGSRVLTVCISAAGRLLNIVWEIQTDGSIIRRFDSGSEGPRVRRIGAVVFRTAGANQFVAVICADAASPLVAASTLVLRTWRVDADSIEFVADSGQQMGVGDSASVVSTASGHLVVVCRDRNRNLLLIPFSVAENGTAIDRIVGGEAKAGKVREVVAVVRPYGLLTSLISNEGHVLLIKWGIEADGTVLRLGESGTQAGAGSAMAAAALPFADRATICTVVRDGSTNLLPVTWDDVGGPGELSVV